MKWEVKTLGEVCEIEIGKTPSRSNPKFWDKEKKTNNVWLSIADLTKNNGTEIFDSKEYVSNVVIPNMKYVKKGTLMVSFKLSLGKLVFAGKDLFTNEAIASLKIKDEEYLDKFFLYYVLKVFDWDNATKGEHKVKGKTLNKAKLKEIPIPLPPLETQKEIVKFLDSSFEKIEKLKEDAQKNLENAKEIFESELNSIFENPFGTFVVKKLGEVCNLYQGLAINSKTKHLLIEKSNFPLLRIKDLKNNSVEQYVKGEGTPKNSFVNENEIIYTRTGSLGLVFRGRNGVLHNNSFKVIPDSSYLLNDYLFLWLTHRNFKSKIISLAMRAAQPDITHKLFSVQEIKIPSLDEQQEIVDKLNKLQEKTKQLEEIYEKKLQNIEELKQSLLQKAFEEE